MEKQKAAILGCGLYCFRRMIIQRKGLPDTTRINP